jgi:hypothetical protein
MHDEETLRAVGVNAVLAVRARRDWIHRRVESLTFPSPASRIFRRDVSIDFTIPEIRSVKEGRAPERYYVPLSVLRKWPPLLKLDLRTGAGVAIPLLTREQNAVVDGALLRQLAEELLVARTIAKPNQLDGLIETLVGAIDTGPHSPASQALRDLLPPRRFGDAERALEPWQRALREDDLFVELAGGLRDHTLLWLRVEGEPGDREIVKFSYEIAMKDQLTLREAAAYGLAPFEVEFQAPHLGNSGSYHLTLSTPSPVAVVDAEMVIKQPGTLRGGGGSYVVAQCSSKQREKEENGLNLYAEAFPHEARFYVAGNRTGLQGGVWVALMIEKRSFVRAAAAAAIAIAVVLGIYLDRLETIVSKPGSAVSLLLLVPGLLAYLLVRPAEHPLVGQFLRGLRGTLLASGSLALAGAATLVVHGNGPPGPGLYLWFWILFVAALLCAGLLTLGVILPIGSSRFPLSRDAKNARTAPPGREV